MTKEKKSRRYGRYVVDITTPDRILFPKDKITKQQLIDYYVDHAEYILPYMKDRPISMHRFPEGIDKEGFYQKNAAEYFPHWIKTKAVKHENRTVNYVVCNNVATLAYLANQAMITPHLWLSKIDALHKPDRMIFDLDPAGNDFSKVRTVAKNLRVLLENELKLTSFVMTTGSKGLHIWVPLRRTHDFEMVHEIAHDIARIMHARYNNLVTLEIRKDKRSNKVFVDYLRNSFSATAVAPYAVRAKPGAPIATPLDWEEVDDAKLNPQKYTITTIDRRLRHAGNPWQKVMKSSSSLRLAQKTIKKLLRE